jgi:hypothetical protein
VLPRKALENRQLRPGSEGELLLMRACTRKKRSRGSFERGVSMMSSLESVMNLHLAGKLLAARTATQDDQHD